MAEDCAQGKPLGWQEFVRDYLPLARRLLLSYFPVLELEMREHVTAIFRQARDSAWFTGLKFSNEREFLMAFRDLVFAYGRGAGRVPAPTISVEQYLDLIKDLSLVEREMLWLAVKGYTAAEVAGILMNAAATAEAVEATARERLPKVLPGTAEDVFRASVRELLEAAAATASDQCLPWKTFNNLINGQTTWRERELAEAHIKDCLNCIDRFTSFAEMIRLRRDTQAATEAEVRPILAALGIEGGSRSLMNRLFSRA